MKVQAAAAAVAMTIDDVANTPVRQLDGIVVEGRVQWRGMYRDARWAGEQLVVTANGVDLPVRGVPEAVRQALLSKSQYDAPAPYTIVGRLGWDDAEAGAYLTVLEALPPRGGFYDRLRASRGEELVYGVPTGTNLNVVRQLLRMNMESGDAIVSATTLARDPLTPAVLSAAEQLHGYGMTAGEAIRRATQIVEAGDPETILASIGRLRGIGMSVDDAVTSAILKIDAAAGHQPVDQLATKLARLPRGEMMAMRETLSQLQQRLRITLGSDAMDTELLEAATKYVDENVARIDGTIVDGYGGYPDYAHFGRIQSLLELRTLRASVRETAAPRSGAADTIGW